MGSIEDDILKLEKKFDQVNGEIVEIGKKVEHLNHDIEDKKRTVEAMESRKRVLEEAVEPVRLSLEAMRELIGQVKEERINLIGELIGVGCTSEDLEKTSLRDYIHDYNRPHPAEAALTGTG